MKRSVEPMGYSPLQVYNHSPLENVPVEIVDLFLSKLTESQAPPTRLVCKFWNERIVTMALQNILEIKNFVNFLNLNLKANKESEKAQFFKLQESVKTLLAIQNPFHYGKFNLQITQVKEHFFNLLMGLNLEDITSLRTVSIEKVQLNGFGHVFDVAEIYKRIELMDQMPFDDLKSKTLKCIAYDIPQIVGNFDKPKNSEHAPISLSIAGLKPILRKKLSREAVTTALIYVFYVVQYSERHPLCQEIAKHLSIQGEVDLALHLLAYFIRNKDDRISAYDELSTILMLMKQEADVLKVATKIETEKSKNYY